MKTLPDLLAEVSKVEFMTPNGPYHTEFTSEPALTEHGLLLDLGIYKGVDLTLNSSSLRSIFKRSNLSFIRPAPSYETDIQPLITNSFLNDLKPMVFQSIHQEMIMLDLTSNHTVSIPFSRPLELNITKFNIDQDSIAWNPLTDITFVDEAIHMDVGISFVALAEYQTNSKYFLPNSSLVADIKDFRVIADVGLELVNSSLIPDFKTLNITMQKLDVYNF